MSGDSCKNCAWFDDSVAAIEAAFPGLTSMGSAQAAVRADDGLCALHERYIAADRRCAAHTPRNATAR